MNPATGFDLHAYLADEGRAVERALARAVDDDALAGALPEDVGQALRHGVLTGGKRLRPILCVTAFRAVAGGDRARHGPGAALYDLGASVELIHAYSLVHDDLPCMDDAELRRGAPTTHRVHGERAAVRAGAALIPCAALLALRASRALGCGPEASAEVGRVLMRAAGAGGMVGGQWLDLLGEGKRLDGPALDDLHARKTGALHTASLVMGALAAGADAGTVDRLRTYGEAIGLAFQIADDVLDATASADVLGKNPSDAALDKSTYVSLYGLDDARTRARAQVERASAALSEGGIRAPALEALAAYVVERER